MTFQRPVDVWVFEAGTQLSACPKCGAFFNGTITIQVGRWSHACLDCGLWFVARPMTIPGFADKKARW